MNRNIAAAVAIAMSLAATPPALAYSLRYLEPQERDAMLNTCQLLHGKDRTLCQHVVDDSHVIANEKRSCLEAMTLLMQGTVWAATKSLPPTLTCRAGLSRAGYPVRAILQRLHDGT